MSQGRFSLDLTLRYMTVSQPPKMMYLKMTSCSTAMTRHLMTWKLWMSPKTKFQLPERETPLLVEFLTSGGVSK